MDDRERSGVFFHVARSFNQPEKQSFGRRQAQLEHRYGTPRTFTKEEPILEGNPQTLIQRNLPLLDVTADINVVGTNSRTTLTQVFSNCSDKAIRDATYVFPLYDGSTIVSFKCWTGEGFLVEGIVNSNEEARKSYTTAAKEQKFAAILSEKTPEIFETRMGTIAANTRIRVEIVYLNELKPDLGGEGVLVTLPTSIAPRYGPNPLWDYMQNRIAPAQLEGKGMKVRVEVSAPDPIIGLESRTHPIAFKIGSVEDPVPTNDITALSKEISNRSTVDRTKGHATMSYPTTVLQRDFVLLIKVDSASMLKPRALMEKLKESPNTSALQLSFTPLDLFTEVLPKETKRTELIFVVDRSGSMADEKITLLKQALSFSLQNLQQQGDCPFNICSFGSTSEMLWRHSKPCSESGIREALKFITTLHADMGGTELMPALQRAVEYRAPKSSTQIIVLTDGELWDYEGVMDYVDCTREKFQDRIRFFSLGIGDEVSHQLVEGIGRRGGGLSIVVAAQPQGDWESGVRRMLQGALAPDNWDCSVKLTSRLHEKEETCPCPDSGQFQAPFDIPSLHAFSPFTLYFLFESGQPPFDEVQVEGRSSNGQLVIATIPIRDVYVPTPTIHTLAAKAIIKDLEGTHSFLHDKVTKTKKSKTQTNTAQQVRSEAVRIGKRWNIAGKWTSFICVDMSTEEERAARIYQPDRMEIAELMESNDMSVFDPFGSYSDASRNPASLLPPFDSKNYLNCGGDDDDDDDNDDAYEGNDKSNGRTKMGSASTCADGMDQPLTWPYNGDDEDGNSDHGPSGSSRGSSSFSSMSQKPSSTGQASTQSSRTSNSGSNSRGSKRCGSWGSESPDQTCFQPLSDSRDSQDTSHAPYEYKSTLMSKALLSKNSYELLQTDALHPYSFPTSKDPYDLLLTTAIEPYSSPTSKKLYDLLLTNAIEPCSFPTSEDYNERTRITPAIKLPRDWNDRLHPILPSKERLDVLQRWKRTLLCSFNSTGISKNMAAISTSLDVLQVNLNRLGHVQSPSGSFSWSQLDECSTKDYLTREPVRSFFNSTIVRVDKQQLSQLIVDILQDDFTRTLACSSPAKSNIDMKQRAVPLAHAEYKSHFPLKKRLETIAQGLLGTEGPFENLPTLLQDYQTISDTVYDTMLSVAFMMRCSSILYVDNLGSRLARARCWLDQILRSPEISRRLLSEASCLFRHGQWDDLRPMEIKSDVNFSIETRSVRFGQLPSVPSRRLVSLTGDLLSSRSHIEKLQ